MGYNLYNECPRCGSRYSDNLHGYIWLCRGCNNRFDNKNQTWEVGGKAEIICNVCNIKTTTDHSCIEYLTERVNSLEARIRNLEEVNHE